MVTRKNDVDEEVNDKHHVIIIGIVPVKNVGKMDLLHVIKILHLVTSD